MPRTEESNQRIREEQKRKIIIAATTVFARKGLAATKMADIATEAGLSYGLLYHYFENKELIFKACVERSTLAFERLITYSQNQAGEPWERLVQLTNIVLDGMKRVPEGFLIANQAFVSESVPPAIREMAREQTRRAMAFFEEIIVAGQQVGQIVAGNPGELTLLYFACIGGVAQDLAYMGIPAENYPRTETLLRLLKP
jgi:AcrR family transcriptional regulator